MAALIFFGFLAAVIIVPQYLRYRERERLHDTLRLAFERGQPVPPEMIEALQSRSRLEIDPGVNVVDRPHRDLRRGVIWLAIGLGFVGFGAAMYCGLYDSGGSEEVFGAMSAIGSIPICIGLAFLGLWYFGRSRRGV